MSRVYVEDNQLCFGQHLRVSFQRTLRVPEGEREFPLPPSFGAFPVQVFNGDKSVDSCESEILTAVIPMRPQEALWFGFEGTDGYPHAVMIGAGEINVLTGELWDESLSASPQNYIVSPDQPWLDGINAGDGFVRQFVATTLGFGLALEEQLGAREVTGGIRITVFGAKSELLPLHASSTPEIDSPSMEGPPGEEQIALGAGGKIRQQLYPDPYGLEVWDTSAPQRAFIDVLNSAQYRALTGLEAPPTPIDAQTYARLGLPWFELEDDRDDLPPAERLTGLKTVGADEAGDQTSDIEQLHVRRLRRGSTRADE